MSEHAATPTRFLIRHDYERRGCFDWNKPKFIRLCAQLGETEIEVAERIGIRAESVLQRRYRVGFTDAEGILLTHIKETIDLLKAS